MTMALTETRAPAPMEAPAARSSIARVAVAGDLATFEGVWRGLERDGVASPYQSFDWVRLWHEKVSGPKGEAPLIVAGFDAGGNPIFLWPFVRERFGPFRVATISAASMPRSTSFPGGARRPKAFAADDMKFVLRADRGACARPRLRAAVQSAGRLERRAQSVRAAAAPSLDRGQFRPAYRRPVGQGGPGAGTQQFDALAACATRSASSPS